MSVKSKLIKYLFILLLFFIMIPSGKAQEGMDDSKRVYFGGSFGAQFGDETVLEISPLVGYRLTNNFSVGVGLTYMYYSFTDFYSGINYNTNIYGGRLFAKDYVFRNFFAYAEYEVLNLEEPNALSGELQRVTTNNPLVGAGFSQPIGRNAFVNFMVLWDINPDVYSPYSNPIIRIGFTF
jgi:hypothetical protein